MQIDKKELWRQGLIGQTVSVDTNQSCTHEKSTDKYNKIKKKQYEQGRGSVGSKVKRKSSSHIYKEKKSSKRKDEDVKSKIQRVSVYPSKSDGLIRNTGFLVLPEDRTMEAGGGAVAGLIGRLVVFNDAERDFSTPERISLEEEDSEVLCCIFWEVEVIVEDGTSRIGSIKAVSKSLPLFPRERIDKEEAEGLVFCKEEDDDDEDW